MNVISDVFPAYVTVTPPGENADSFPISESRVVLTADRILVVKDHIDGPQVVFDQEIDPSDYVKEGPQHEITTKAGLLLQWTKDSACGCGSRLRTWRPYRYLGA